VIANSPLKRWWLPRLLPDRWLDFAVRKALKIERPGATDGLLASGGRQPPVETFSNQSTGGRPPVGGARPPLA
jgi:hypothetical protein